MKLPKFARSRSTPSLSSPSEAASHYFCFSLAKSSRAKQGSSVLISGVSNSSPAANSRSHMDYTAAPSQNDGNPAASLCTAPASLRRLPSDSMAQELKQVFAQFDANHDGKISVDELCAMLGSLGVEAARADAELMVEEVDANGDGFIDLQEFMELHREHMQVMAQDDLRATFEIFDLNKDGHITAQELHAVLTNLGDDGHTSLEDCNLMIRSVDRKGIGHVDLDDFKLMMMHV